MGVEGALQVAAPSRGYLVWWRYAASAGYPGPRSRPAPRTTRSCVGAFLTGRAQGWRRRRWPSSQNSAGSHSLWVQRAAGYRSGCFWSRRAAWWLVCGGGAYTSVPIAGSDWTDRPNITPTPRDGACSPLPSPATCSARDWRPSPTPPSLSFCEKRHLLSLSLLVISDVTDLGINQIALFFRHISVRMSPIKYRVEGALLQRTRRQFQHTCCRLFFPGLRVFFMLKFLPLLPFVSKAGKPSKAGLTSQAKHKTLM